MRARILALAVLALMPNAVSARPGWTSGTFVYANLCTEPGGAMAGRRVVLHRSPNGNDVTYEAAAGTLGAKKPAAALSIDDGTQAIAFTVEEENGPVRFRGTAAPTYLAGTVADHDGEHPLKLRRVLRSHEHEGCRSTEGEPETTASTD